MFSNKFSLKPCRYLILEARDPAPAGAYPILGIFKFESRFLVERSETTSFGDPIKCLQADEHRFFTLRSSVGFDVTFLASELLI
jgi:hypothetical protein